MRDVYSKYWIRYRENVYDGFSEYNTNLCEYICARIPKGRKLLEIAIGTGYPFADYFQKSGYLVYGIDISPDLIAKCSQVNPNINCKVGDAENMDYSDNYFDCSYCFNSTWYFTDLNRVIDEMLRVTLPVGLVIFDIQNRNNKGIDNAYQNRVSESKGLGKATRYLKNICKFMIGRDIQNWHSIIYEIPTVPRKYL
jgi:ubiquinone/menaquinone biosynthesis C-methylase UbiE